MAPTLKNLLPIAAILALIAGGCAHQGREGVDMIEYQKALAQTDPAKAGMLQPGSPEEQEAVARFEDFTGSSRRRSSERACTASTQRTPTSGTGSRKLAVVDGFRGA